MSIRRATRSNKRVKVNSLQPSLFSASTRVKQSPKQLKNAGLKTRMLFCAVVSFICFMFVGGKLLAVGVAPPAEPKSSIYAMPYEAPRRGDIYDRNGVLLATTLESYSLFADPKVMLSDKSSAAKKISKALGGELSAEDLEEKFSRKGRFVWIKRDLTPLQAQAVNSTGIPGLGFRKEQVRMYPQRHTASHIVGAVNTDGKGIAGLEVTYNNQLSKGEDVYLTIDIRLQQALRQSLVEALEKSEAKSAWGVVVHPMTGEVLALSSLPDFDPNHYSSYSPNEWKNRAVRGVYEMGSTFKLLTVAQGLEEGYITPETEVDASKPIRIGRFRIRDFHGKYRPLTTREILVYSSNIGSSRIAEMIGGEGQREFFRRLNLLDPLSIGFSGAQKPLYPERIAKTYTMTLSYGHGIAITPLHMAAAISAIVGDGKYRYPYIGKDDVTPAEFTLVSPQTVSDMRSMMRDVVQLGSGRRTKIKGFDIGGKTGTSEKVAASGGYSKKDRNLASFVGAFPLDDPKLVGVIMVDEGKKDFNMGGQIAAPTFGSFIKRAAPILAMGPNE